MHFKKWLEIGCDVMTTAAICVFSSYWCIKDIGDAFNVGICMLYVFD